MLSVGAGNPSQLISEFCSVDQLMGSVKAHWLKHLLCVSKDKHLECSSKFYWFVKVSVTDSPFQCLHDKVDVGLLTRPTPGEELQAIKDCLERENQSAPRMRPLVDYPIQNA